MDHPTCQSCRRPATESLLSYRRGSTVVRNDTFLQCDICERYMKLAAAKGIAATVADEELAEDYIIPSVFNRDVSRQVARAVAKEAERTGAVRALTDTAEFSIPG